MSQECIFGDIIPLLASCDSACREITLACLNLRRLASTQDYVVGSAYASAEYRDGVWDATTSLVGAQNLRTADARVAPPR